jgi:hypothetical protein
MSQYMSLKEALSTIALGKEPTVLNAAGVDWEAETLLTSLPERKLQSRVHFMPGFYIAAVSDSGCLGEVLYRLKKKIS